MGFNHATVLLNETVDLLNVKPGGLYIDYTLGGGGHTSLILERGGTVVGIDRDDLAIENAKERFKGKDFIAVHDNFANIEQIADKLNLAGADGIIADLGVSSPQLDDAGRGFSYMQDAPLDMRMDRRGEFCAYNVVNEYSEQELLRVISGYGEERWASRIAKFIIQRREEKPIETTLELVDVIKAAIPLGARKDGPHPAKRTFQAIRIEVNGELRILENSLRSGIQLLNKGGRMCVITFHSLEDRIVKSVFSSMEGRCTCPKNFPVCVCGCKKTVKAISKKPIEPSEKELADNPRARSSKLRAVEKID